MDRSLIAGANAWFRASESQRSAASRILSDPWAIHLAERDPRVQAVRFGRFVLPPLARQVEDLQTAHCVRHAAIDALVLRAVEEGARQLVIIGAGYDMRASRFGNELGSVRVLEVDHPATAARKIQRLRDLPGVVPVERVSLDLSHEDLRGFDPDLPTCFVAEGFIHYLAPYRFDALLSAMERVAHRRVILSFIRSEMYARANSTFLGLIKLMREIPKLHFTPKDLEGRLARHGLRGFRWWDAAAQVEELVPRARGRRIVLSQDIAVAGTIAGHD